MNLIDVKGQLEKVVWSSSYFFSVSDALWAARSATRSSFFSPVAAGLTESSTTVGVSVSGFNVGTLLILLAMSHSPDHTMRSKLHQDARRTVTLLPDSDIAHPHSPVQIKLSIEDFRAPHRFYSVLLGCCSPRLLRAQAVGDAPQSPASPQSGLTASPASGSTPAPSPQVLEAEALLAKSDWKADQTKLAAWLADHPSDARALFDAGCAADAQNQMDDAAAFYRRAIEANPTSFEAHLSLGLLLARQGKVDGARPQLVEATKLDPGEAGSAVKARAWRALAQLDRLPTPVMEHKLNEMLEHLSNGEDDKDDEGNS